MQAGMSRARCVVARDTFMSQVSGASSDSQVSLSQLCAVAHCSVAVRGGPLYEPHLKSNVCFFVVDDLGLIEPLRLTQACSLSVAVPADLEKSCLLAGNMHLFVCVFLSVTYFTHSWV